ncbi:hypothetical protein KR074_005702 [Drosophila pseudoananassae]|nr:hypothetical protein KR074_005702 [Drosophila pseudoananassae]
MATTTTQSAAVAAPALSALLPTSHRSQSESQSSSSRSSTASTNNNNSSTTTTVISQPIKIPLSERFSSQTSTGSADSGVIVSSASQQQLQQLQLPPPRSSSGSLSLPQAPPGGKWRQKKQQQQQLLLSQDSGIENGVATSSGKSGQAGTATGGSSKGKENGGNAGNSSSESLESGGIGVAAENPPRIRAASALELSTSSASSGVGGVGGSNILRSRIKYKSTNSTGTQGFDVEDRIDEVDICDDDDDDEEEEEDDGVNVDDVEEADNQSDSQSGIIINLKNKQEDPGKPEGSGDQAGKSAGGTSRLPPPDQAELTVAAALARRRDAKSLATDGHIYFPLLKISEDPHIDAKLINRKDGLQDTMYYLDEFGSPKLREKFARKQKQLLAKQQKQLLKRERRSEEQRKKRNTTVASNLAASGETKDEPHCDSSTIRSKHNSVPPIRIQEHPDDDHLDVHVAEAEDDETADGPVKMRRHSHDNHYDSQQSSRRTIAQANNHTRPANPDQDDDQDQDIEQGAEPLLEDQRDESPDNLKTAKLARTQSCVSWTKVVQKFKNILGMKQLIGKLNDLWPEHSVALSIPKEVDRSKEKLEGAWETTGRDGSKITTVVATPGQGTDRVQEVSYTDTKVIGNGSFGVVFQAKLCDTGELVAIKKVLQDRRFKNRELQIMRKLEHCNIVKLLYFFYSSGEKRDEVFLNLVLEYIPETVYKVARQYAKTKQTIPINFIRLYMYQLFRSLAYIHSLGICHRDIKPQNLLLDPETAVLKLCDFGSAKQLLHGEPNVSYICSRYYRAPELIFGAINYTTKIDVWSAGCVLAELLLGQPIFPGDSGVDQLVEVIKVLGTPTREQIREMNPNYTEFKFPQIKSHPWQKVFRIRTPTEAINLVSLLLEYTPSARITPLKACAHPFFDELRMEGNHTLPNGREMPPLFNFTEHELSIQPSLVPQLLPKHLQNAAGGAAGNRSSAGASAAASGSTSVSSTGSGASAEGSAQPQQQAASGTAAAAGSASGAAAGSGSGSSAAGTAAGASGGAAGTSGSGSGGNSSSGGGGGVGAPAAGNAQQAAASIGGGGGGGAAAAAATGATASGAIAATNAGGANVTGSQSNSALNNSTGNGNGNGSGNGNGGGSAGSGNGETADEAAAGAAAETPAAAAENEAAASG